jgi:hypothetical protein
MFVGFLLIIAAMFSFGYYFILTNINECTRDPIKYGVEQIRENNDAESVYGSITFTTSDNIKRWDFGDMNYSYLE